MYFFTQKDFIMRQQWWFGLVKDYDYEIMYHPDKANKVADALSKKCTASLMTMTKMSNPLRTKIESFDLELLIGQLSALTITSTMFDNVKEKQDCDLELQRIRKGM